MKKLNMEEINEQIEFEDRCGVQNLIQEIFSHEHAEKGLDVIDDGNEIKVVSGTTFKVTTTEINK